MSCVCNMRVVRQMCKNVGVIHVCNMKGAGFSSQSYEDTYLTFLASAAFPIAYALDQYKFTHITHYIFVSYTLHIT